MDDVTVVTGFIKDVDRLPKGLVIPSPYGRIAVVTDTYDPSPEAEGSMVIPFKFLAGLASELRRGRDVAVTSDLNGKLRVTKNLSDFEIERLISDDQFHSVLFFEREAPCLQIFEMRWFAVGGPQPYHDSATLEIYMPEVNFLDTLNQIKSILLRKGATVNIISGGSTPMEVPWWKTILEFIYG